MKVKALRGVCIGVDRHLTPVDPPVDLDDATGQFLVSIGAAEQVKDEPKVEAAPEKPSKAESEPVKTGKKEK